MRILITGVTGFTGLHLARLLLKKEEPNQIYGTYRRQLGNREYQEVYEKMNLVKCDVKDWHGVEKMIGEVKPDLIFHLAAYATVAHSFDYPTTPFRTNVLRTVNILEAVKRKPGTTKILILGTAEEYGQVEQKDMPIKESHPLNPKNPYGISKVSQELLGLYYHKALGMDIYLSRTFYTTGPAQPPEFVCSASAKQIADIEKGKQNVIKVGNLNAKRDFIDMRDVARAYLEIVENSKPDVAYNICRGESISVQTILNILLQSASHSVNVVIDKTKLRPLDVLDFVDDNSRTKKQTLWAPEIVIEDTLKDLLNFWRS